jgi:hypothetical protein
MKGKKRSQGIRDKNTRKNYNNNIKVGNIKSRSDVNSSEDTHSPPSSSIDSSLMQKSLSASTITKKQGEKISSGVIDSSKYEPAREKEEGESLSAAATIHEKDIGNKKNEFFGIHNDESISPGMSVSTKLSANPDSINSNSNFSNANSVIIEKEVEVVEKQVEQVEQQQRSTVTNKANEGEKEEGESLSSIALQYRNNKNQGNDGKRNFGNNKSNIKNNNNYNNPHIGGTSIGMLQNPAIAWFDMYNELSRNAARMTERWLNLFWNPWITSERKNNNTKK